MAKTNWQYNEVVSEIDLNHIGQEINEKESIIGVQQKIQQLEQNAREYADGLFEEVETMVDLHRENTMPHCLTDGVTTYKYGFRVENGNLIFMYEEVE